MTNELCNIFNTGANVSTIRLPTALVDGSYPAKGCCIIMLVAMCAIFKYPQETHSVDKQNC